MDLIQKFLTTVSPRTSPTRITKFFDSARHTHAALIRIFHGAASRGPGLNGPEVGKHPNSVSE